MTKLEDLIKLEKKSDVELHYCEFISDDINEEENIRTRLLKLDDKYYFHQMHNGEVIKCFEIALSWIPFKNIFIFDYTPDDVHIYSIDSRQPTRFDVYSLKDEQITSGANCSYNGMTIEYIKDDELKFNNNVVKVEKDSGFTYKILKTKIKAINGAKGLYKFLENIAEEGKIKYPTFKGSWEMFQERYC